jgi:hypothetical protein
MNDAFKSLDRTYNQRDIREREGSRELAVIEDEGRGGNEGRGDGIGEEKREEKREQAERQSAELSW